MTSRSRQRSYALRSGAGEAQSEVVIKGWLIYPWVGNSMGLLDQGCVEIPQFQQPGLVNKLLGLGGTHWGCPPLWKPEDVATVNVAPCEAASSSKHSLLVWSS